MQRLLPLAIAFCWYLNSPACFAEERGDITAQEQGLAAASNALGYLEKEGDRWIERQGCVSCHQIPSMLWSLSAAQTAGLDVSPAQLNELANWSLKPVNFVKPEQKADHQESDTLSGNIDTMAALLLAIDPDLHGPAPEIAGWREKFVNALVAEQADDGSWKACGQLPAQKRDVRETTAATTAWVSLALLRAGADFERSKSLQVIDSVEAATSTEWHAVRLLLAAELQTEVDEYRSKLLKLQNDDGGWGWLHADASDALGTGLALYALKAVGRGQNLDALDRAASYLVSSQLATGGWKVNGTKSSSRGRPTPTSNYWGTAWATIALTTPSGSY